MLCIFFALLLLPSTMFLWPFNIFFLSFLLVSSFSYLNMVSNDDAWQQYDDHIFVNKSLPGLFIWVTFTFCFVHSNIMKAKNSLWSQKKKEKKNGSWGSLWRLIIKPQPTSIGTFLFTNLNLTTAPFSFSFFFLLLFFSLLKCWILLQFHSAKLHVCSIFF